MINISLGRIQRKDIYFSLFIFLFAVCIKIFYFTDFKLTQVYPILPYSDSFYYFSWAKDIAAGDILGSKVFMKWPLYGYFLGGWFKLFGDNVSAVFLFQFLLGAFNCVLVYFIGSRLFNSVVGAIAALICACYGLFIFYESQLVYVSLSLFLNFILFICFLFARKGMSPKKMFFLGIVLGLATLAQSNIIVFGLLGCVWLIWENRSNLKSKIFYFISFSIGLGIIVGVVGIRNYFVERDIVPLTGHLGLNFYLGNGPEATGKFHVPDYITPEQEGMFKDGQFIAESQTQRRMKPSEVSVFWFKKSFAYIRTNPLGYLKLMGKKIAYLFLPDEPNHDAEYSLLTGKIRAFNFLFTDLRFILPLFFAGLILGAGELKKNILLYLITFSFAFTIITFFVTTRYRVMMVPFMSLFAGLAAYEIFVFLKKRKFLVFLAWIFFLGATFILLNLSSRLMAKNEENLSPYFLHFYKGVRFLDRQDFGDAILELNAACKINPNRKNAFISLGSAYYGVGNFIQAEDSYKQAVKIAPYAIDAYYDLGILYNNQKRYSEAKEALKKAVMLDPEDAAAHYELGKTFQALGDIAHSRDEFRQAQAKINRWRIQERKIIEAAIADLGR